MEHAITLNHISKRYNDLYILEDITYSFSYGTFYGIVGASGAGKTTLLQCIGTLDRATGGDLFVLGRSVKSMSEKELSLFRNQHIGFVFQSYFLNDKLTATENVMLPMLLSNVSLNDCQRKAENLLAYVGLEQRMGHYPKQLSGGEQQRVAIARALANNPDIILADEPTGNLDAENEQNVIRIFRSLVRDAGKTVVMVTHNVSLLKQVDQVLKLESGCLNV